MISHWGRSSNVIGEVSAAERTQAPQLSRLFEKGKIGNMQLKNRLVMAPMATLGADRNGYVTERVIDYYVERAKGGVGLIITMTARVTPEAPAVGRLGIHDDKFVPRLKKLTGAIHRYGAKVVLQISHQSTLLTPPFVHKATCASVGCLVGPSAVSWPWEGESVRELSKQDILHIEECFAEGGRRAKEAGFDGVQIIGGHRYLITDFLSPLRNRRADEYGGSVANRARFACEVISAVRKKVGPDFPILFRFSATDFLEGGISIEDSVSQAPLFVRAGADALDVSAGNSKFSVVVPTFMQPNGALVHLAAAVKKIVAVPVITAGKITDPILAERILEEGKADFIALGRGLLADPELPRKLREGRFKDIRKCISCNNCHHELQELIAKKVAGTRFSCTVNPALLREREFIIKRTASPKRVMVIGGGLAGMEAARVLAERGHDVSLYERSDRLGGQWNIVSKQTFKREFASVTEYMVQGLEKAGVRVTLNKNVTARLVQDERPDVVVLATGATPRTLDVPGVDGKNVIQATDVFTGRARVGDRVVVVGGRLQGMEAADFLAEQGRKVSLVTKGQLGEDGVPLERLVFFTLRDKLIEHGVYIYANAVVREIRENGVYVSCWGGMVFLKSDTVVLAMGATSERTLQEELERMGFRIHSIGDCVEPRNGLHAVQEGAEIGREI